MICVNRYCLHAAVHEPDFIVLLRRANTAAKELSMMRYCGESKWIAEVRLRMIHEIGVIEAFRAYPPYVERFEIKVEILPELNFRRLTLEETELIM